MFVIVAQALFFFLPAYLANGAPVVFAKIRWLERFKKPIDSGKKLGTLSIFGENKTYFGFIIGVSGATVTGLLQACMFMYFPEIHWLFLVNYSFIFAVILGFLLGFGALLGDLLKSFMKRRLHIQNGKPFFPFDQLDFVVGGLLLGGLVYFPSWIHVLTLVLLTPLIHIISNILGYKLGLKKVWW